MSKSLALAAALLVALIAIAGATRYTTTVITTAIDEANPSQFQKCQQEIQDRQFRSCQGYLSQGSHEDQIKQVTRNSGSEERYLKDCCKALTSVSDPCECEALKQAVRQLQQSGESELPMHQVYRRASALPSKCEFKQRDCSLPVVFM